ncbi:hypothetical protein JCM16303_000677 [Sporobolomyces ruberrimus]
MPTTTLTQDITRLTADQATYDYFRANHLVPNLPCIFPPSLVQSWSLNNKWFARDDNLDYDYLTRTYGALRVDCVDCAESGEPDPSTFGKLLELWRAGGGQTKYLKDWHLPLAIQRTAETTRKGKEKLVENLYEVPQVCIDDWMNEYECNEFEGKGDDFRFVYAGGRNTLTALHRDVYCSYSISTQIHGRKLWYLFPPTCTPSLQPLITAANREGKGVNCDGWSDNMKEEFARKGMVKVWQESKETIFIPSGWYHSVHNLSHPTFSLNHNWSNSHNLPAIYSSLSDEVLRCREAIEDVKELLIMKAGRDGREPVGEQAWKAEWEAEVDGLVERSEGWSWRTFWKMVANTLKSLEIPREELELLSQHSRWPLIPPTARPPTEFVLQQVKPLVEDFRRREDQEWKWLEGLDKVLQVIDDEVARLSDASTRRCSQ